MKYMVLAAALTMGATGAFAAPEKYTHTKTCCYVY